jgi:hypothetical protein
LLAHLELRALLEVLGQAEQLLAQWFMLIQTHRSLIQTQEIMFITGTRLTTQIDTDIKFVVLTIITPHTTILGPTMRPITLQVTEKLAQSICPQSITEALIMLRPTTQTHTVIMAAITTLLTMMDPMVVFTTGMDIGGMLITN